MLSVWPIFPPAENSNQLTQCSVLNLCEVVIITIYCISAFQDKYTIKLEPIPLDVGIKEKFPGGVSHSDVILVRVDMKVKPLLLDTKPGGL